MWIRNVRVAEEYQQKSSEPSQHVLLIYPFPDSWMPIFHMNTSHLQASETLPIPLPHSMRRIRLINSKAHLSNGIVGGDSSDMEDGINEVCGDGHKTEVGILDVVPARGIYMRADGGNLISIFSPLHVIDDSE